jgi:hypothetical protein
MEACCQGGTTKTNALSAGFLPLDLCQEFQVVVRAEPEPAEEFVPGPGTMLLLASGLAGMTRYTFMRRRAGQ